jgi:L-arabinose isomerase
LEAVAAAVELGLGEDRLDHALALGVELAAGLGGPHHQVLNPGRVAGAWEVFGSLAGLEVVQV